MRALAAESGTPRQISRSKRPARPFSARSRGRWDDSWPQSQRRQPSRPCFPSSGSPYRSGAFVFSSATGGFRIRGRGRDEFEEKAELLQKFHTVEPNKTNQGKSKSKKIKSIFFYYSYFMERRQRVFCNSTIHKLRRAMGKTAPARVKQSAK